jgi:hypothetical protein
MKAGDVHHLTFRPGPEVIRELGGTVFTLAGMRRMPVTATKKKMTTVESGTPIGLLLSCGSTDEIGHRDFHY